MKIRNQILSALLLGAFATAPAFAGPVIDWDPAYVYGPGASTTVTIPGRRAEGRRHRQHASTACSASSTRTIRPRNTRSSSVVCCAADGRDRHPRVHVLHDELQRRDRSSSTKARRATRRSRRTRRTRSFPSTFQDGVLLLSGVLHVVLHADEQLHGDQVRQHGGQHPLDRRIAAAALQRRKRPALPGPVHGRDHVEPGARCWESRATSSVTMARSTSTARRPTSPSTWGKLKANYR